jgi:glycosyltransferase involved in cell wall biosynthesis
MRIIQVGAYPPPYGGVTVHLMRLHEELRRLGKESTIVDLSSIKKDTPGVTQLGWSEATSYLAKLPRSVVHFHNFSPGNAGAYERLSRRHVAVLSLHNERFESELASLGPVRRRVAISRLKKMHCVIVDSERCREMARSLLGEDADLRMIPEFIPPTRVPPLEHPGILELRQSCRHLLSSNAWKISFHDGQDLYGLDLLVEMLHRLNRDEGLDVGLAFLIPNPGDEPYFDEIRERIRTLGLEDRWLFVTEPLDESSSLWKASDVVVRATNTDGNSVSVLEALSQGVPVVASDCVERPDGAVLFRTRDAENLTERVAAVLADLPGQRARLERMPETNNAASFVALYDELESKWIAHEA